MRPLTLILLVWIAIVACAALAAAWWFALGMTADSAAAYGKQAAEARAAAESSMSAVRAKVLAHQTYAARERIEALSAHDVLSAAKMIEATGRDAGTSVRAIGASVTGAAKSNGSSSPSLRTVSLSFEAQGSFAQAFRVIELLGALPLPATVDRFDLVLVSSEDPKKAGTSWRASGQVRLLTKNISQN